MNFLHRHIIPNKGVWSLCEACCSIASALVLILGFRRLALLDLDEVQLYLFTVQTLLLTAVFIGLALYFQHQRRAT
jgi:hypothetical protein